uniref:Uncharacterized protein n=1 Tax=Monopterus albus TaxID=43700 RepID=A0A3Q3J0F8_MONAL|nr:general transcription factor 3C polypeptide 2 isoform X1 [Monopterus albus]
MDSIDSGQGEGNPSEQHWDLTPSSKGRQRKKNVKYLDFETDDEVVNSVQQKQCRKGSRSGAAVAKKTPTKSRKAKNATQQTGDGDEEAADKTPQGSDGKTSVKTPKTPRAKKTLSKRTPVTKAPATDGGLPTAEAVLVDPVHKENGTPKPKRKYVRKQAVQKATAVTEPPCEQDQREPPTQPEEQTEPGGRCRRSAARAALKYLHILAKDVFNHSNEESDSQLGATSEAIDTERKGPQGSKVRKGRKRKRPDSEDEDEEFVPDVKKEEEEVEEMEDEEEAEDSDLDSNLGTSGRTPPFFHANKSNTFSNAKTANGLLKNTMKVVWDFTETTKKFREEHYSSWVFPEWIPSSSVWNLVPERDLDKYLPQELFSAAFRVSREGLKKEDQPLQRLSRFGALPAHPDRWDMLLYAGGPVWAMEWCPTPGAAPATQYIALACHRGMDDEHYVNKTYTGAGLVQLWDVGQLEYNSRPDSQPSLAYGLAQDKGFIWHLKWCPAGGWELPSCGRESPFLPRLGLLAVATSTSVVTIYSLPHPDALHSSMKLHHSGNTSQQLPIYQAKEVVTLKLGSFKAPRHEKSGQVLSMDWLPVKPHSVMAVGFNDGVVGLWDLTTKSALLQVRESDGSLSLLPYRCLLAHDHAVRALAFCPASRYLLVTAGEDRYVKTWDLRRLYDPITIQKRGLTNEICWPLNAPGLLWAQETCYATAGTQGVHYFDHLMRAIFAVPRTGTLWSISYTDWLNSVVTSDTVGEVIFALLPQIKYGYPCIKRTIERRFPVYLTSLVPYDTTEEENQEVGGVEEEEDAVEEQEEGKTEEADAGSDGNENDSENRRGGGRCRKDKTPPLYVQKYKESVKKYSLHLIDNNMCTFAGSEKRASWKHMKSTELKMKMNMDEMPLAALHKVRFNPNMNCHTWVASGGQAGLVRLNCLRGMISPQAKNLISKNQDQFSGLDSPQDQGEAVQTEVDQL